MEYYCSVQINMLIFALFFVPTTVGFISSQDSTNLLLGRMLNRSYGRSSFLNTSCPKELTLSWMLRPPFSTLTNSSEGGNEIGGIFHDILDLALYRCCAVINKGNKTRIRYKPQAAASTSVLHEDILNGEVDIFLPVQSDDPARKYRSFLPYLKILDSPGVVLIKRTDSIQRWGGEHVFLWNVIRSCWPIVVLTILLSFIAGMFVWALETRKNTQEFGVPFYRGVFDGFWWAFVTMSTVGYGDKTPKSIIARLFSVVWIMIGVTICSILTATLSSALTSVTIERYDVIAGMKVGAARDSIAIQKAVNLGANAKAFKDLDEVYNALVNEKSIDGMMEEMFMAIEYMKQKKTSLISIVHLFEEKHGYGVAFSEKLNVFNYKLNFLWPWDCIADVVRFVSDDYTYDAINRYINGGTEKSSMDDAPKGAQLLKTYNTIDPNSPQFAGTVIGLCGFTLVILTVYITWKYCREWRVDEQSRDVERGQHVQGAVISHQHLHKPLDEIEFRETELPKDPFTIAGEKERNATQEN